MSSRLRLYQWYNGRKRYLRSGLISGLFCAGGDAISQIFVEKKSLSQYDTSRGIRYLMFGSFTIVSSFGTNLLYKKYLIEAPLKLGMLSLTVLGPTYIITFLSVMDYWKNRSVESMKQKVKNNFLPLYLSQLSMLFVIPISGISYIAFKFLVGGHKAVKRRPIHYHIVLCMIYLTWHTYLAYRSEGDKNNKTF